MRIDVITCHNVYNYGASLQAYALSRYLTVLGHEVKIIDYNPVYLEHYYLWGHVNPKYQSVPLKLAYNFAKFPGRLKDYFFNQRKKNFDCFTKEHLCLTMKKYHTFHDLKVNPPEADIYIAGSDQIWNTLFSNGKDPAFYLQFGEADTKRVSYAASFGSNQLAYGYADRIKSWLSCFDQISIREQSGLEILRSLGFGSAIQAVDPVFLLESDVWEKLIEDSKVGEEYILFYGFEGDESALKEAFQFAHKHGLKLYSMNKTEFCDNCFDDKGPLTFLKLIKNASLIISSSFHATAFSLIFEKDFWVFKRKGSINTRMIDLLDMIGLQNRLIQPEHIRMEKIDYSSISENLFAKIEYSKLFLHEAVLK